MVKLPGQSIEGNSPELHKPGKVEGGQEISPDVAEGSRETVDRKVTKTSEVSQKSVKTEKTTVDLKELSNAEILNGEVKDSDVADAKELLETLLEKQVYDKSTQSSGPAHDELEELLGKVA